MMLLRINLSAHNQQNPDASPYKSQRSELPNPDASPYQSQCSQLAESRCFSIQISALTTSRNKMLLHTNLGAHNYQVLDASPYKPQRSQLTECRYFSIWISALTTIEEFRCFSIQISALTISRIQILYLTNLSAHNQQNPDATPYISALTISRIQMLFHTTYKSQCLHLEESKCYSIQVSALTTSRIQTLFHTNLIAHNQQNSDAFPYKLQHSQLAESRCFSIRISALTTGIIQLLIHSKSQISNPVLLPQNLSAHRYHISIYIKVDVFPNNHNQQKRNPFSIQILAIQFRQGLIRIIISIL